MSKNNKSLELLNMFIEENGEEWRQKFSEKLKYFIEKKNIDDNVFMEFLDSLREDIMDSKNSEIKAVEKKIDNELLYGEIKKYIGDELKSFYAAESLRELSTKYYDEAIKAVDIIFEQSVLRFNPDLDENFEAFGFPTQESFLKSIQVISAMVTFVVKNNLYSGGIPEIIRRNLRLDKKMCDYIAKKIDKNYRDIQIKLILDSLYE